MWVGPGFSPDALEILFCVGASARTHVYTFSLHVFLVLIQTSSLSAGSTEGELDAVRGDGWRRE